MSAVRTCNCAACLARRTPDKEVGDTRQRVYRVLQLGGEVTASDVGNAAIVTLKQAQYWLGAFVAAGFAEARTEHRNHGAIQQVQYYRMTRDNGAHAPDIDGSGNIKPLSGSEAMWRTLKMISNLSCTELAQYASVDGTVVDESTANAYLKLLNKFGYAAVSEPATHSKKARYRLNNYTGPRPPQVLKSKQLYDANHCTEVDAQCHKVSNKQELSA